MPTQPTHAWSPVKAHLKDLDKEELLLLVRDLHALNAENKLFLAARFQTATLDEIAQPYREVILAVFNPSRGFPSLKLSSARKALTDFKKLCRDPLPIIDLMLFYVEQGVICTNTYGDIDAPFYESLVAVYLAAARLTYDLDETETVEDLRARFEKIAGSAAGVGWGLYDDLSDIYLNVVAQEDEAEQAG